MRITRLAAPCAGVDTLLVFLPGSFSRPEDFVDEGLIAPVRSRGIAADVWLVDAHLAYYSERSILDRLEADVIEPARAHGYRAIWLIGISIGGYGAFAYFASGRTLGVGVTGGVVAIAPYLGDRRVSISIESTGGLRSWPAQEYPLPPNADDVRVWSWLKRATAAPTGSAAATGTPPIWLAYGASDRFAFSDRLLAAALPPERTTLLPGGHDWPTWRALWDATLPILPLPSRPHCTATGPAIR